MAKETKQLSQETEVEILKEKIKQLESPDEKKYREYMDRIAKYEALAPEREKLKSQILIRVNQLQSEMPFLRYEDAQRIEAFERRIEFFKEKKMTADETRMLKYKNKYISDLKKIG